MSNLCGSLEKPWPSAWSRCGGQMSNRAKNPETWGTTEMSNSENDLGVRIVDRRGYGDRLCAGQDNPRKYKNQKPVQEHSEQDYEQQLSRQYWEPCRCCGRKCRGQLSPSPASQQRRCGKKPPQFCGPPPQRCCENQTTASSMTSCENQPPALPPQKCYERQPSPLSQKCYERQPSPLSQRCKCLASSSPQRYCCQEKSPPVQAYCCSENPRCCSKDLPPPPRRTCGQDNPPSSRGCCCQKYPSPQRSCSQQPSPQSCCQDTCCPSPSKRCSFQEDSKTNCEDQAYARKCRDKRRRKRWCSRRMKCCSCSCSCECICVVTHEMGVQTDPEPPCQPEPEPEPEPIPDRIEIIDVTTQEREIRHRTGEVEIIVDEVQTVTVVPNDGSQPTKRQVKSRSDTTNPNDPQRTEKHFKEEIDPDSIEVPTSAARYSTLQPMMENLIELPTASPTGYSSPSEVKERRVYTTKEQFVQPTEHDSGKKVTKTVLEDPSEDEDLASASSSPKKTDAKRTARIRSPSTKDVLSPKQKRTANTNYNASKKPVSNFSSNISKKEDEARKFIMPGSKKQAEAAEMKRLSEEEMIAKPIAYKYMGHSSKKKKEEAAKMKRLSEEEMIPKPIAYKYMGHSSKKKNLEKESNGSLNRSSIKNPVKEAEAAKMKRLSEGKMIPKPIAYKYMGHSSKKKKEEAAKMKRLSEEEMIPKPIAYKYMGHSSKKKNLEKEPNRSLNRSSIKNPVKDSNRSWSRSLNRSSNRSSVQNPVKDSNRRSNRSWSRSLNRSSNRSSVQNPAKDSNRSSNKSSVQNLVKDSNRSPNRSWSRSSNTRSSVKDSNRSLNKSSVKNPVTFSNIYINEIKDSDDQLVVKPKTSKPITAADKLKDLDGSLLATLKATKNKGQPSKQEKKDTSNVIKDSEGNLVLKPVASDFSQLSTIHVKVFNRREKLSQKAGRKSVHQDAVFETKISELRLVSPLSEEEEEEEPEPEPEPEPKPKRKKRKKKVPEPKSGYPSNDLVCRMHRPLRRKKCEPRPCRVVCGMCVGVGCRAGCRRCSLPCFVPCAGSRYTPPRCMGHGTQCDPIYGFGSVPSAYYCHR